MSNPSGIPHGVTPRCPDALWRSWSDGEVPPRGAVNTEPSPDTPKVSTTNRGTITVRTSWVFGVPNTRRPDTSVAECFDPDPDQPRNIHTGPSQGNGFAPAQPGVSQEQDEGHQRHPDGSQRLRRVSRPRPR